MATKPFIRGTGAVLRLYFDGDPLQLKVTRWSVKRSSVTHNDGVCGEDRDRLDSTTNHYDISCRVKIEDVKELLKLMDDQKPKDAHTAPPVKAASLALKDRSGAKSAFVAEAIEIDGWALDSAGRSDALEIDIPMRARYWGTAPSL